MISFRKRSPSLHAGAGAYYMHGGGMIIGNRFAGVVENLGYLQTSTQFVFRSNIAFAPEHQDPVLIEDCFAGLKWMAENAVALGVDSNRLIISGSSADGGLAAEVSILARDRGAPELYAQMLLSPMLDDRNQTVSSKQYVE